MVQDFFLRTQMDSKGYIPISLLASFNRIKQLTLDTRLVREVLLLSAFVEVRGGMVRMGGVGQSGQSGPGAGQGGNEGQQEGQSAVGWEAFVLPDAVESVVEDVENGGYGYHNGYGYGSGYGYGFGPGFGYGYGYGYPPDPGLGYFEDPTQPQQPQQQHQQRGYEPSEGVDEHGPIFSTSHHHGEVPLPLMSNGHGGASGNECPIHNLDNFNTAAVHPPKENDKPNGVFKHDQVERHEEDNAVEYEEEEEEEDVVFVMGTDVGTAWTPERERRA